jgi:hypothetical protein
VPFRLRGVSVKLFLAEQVAALYNTGGFAHNLSCPDDAAARILDGKGM